MNVIIIYSSFVYKLMCTYVFTDGACKNNGRKNAKASFASLVGKRVIKGLVGDYTVEFKNNKLVYTSTPCNPSNNRAELCGLIYALCEILGILDYNDINIETYILNDYEYDKLYNSQDRPLITKTTIYSDSLICVNTMLKWYDNRERNGSLDEFKNLDLITIMMQLYKQISKNVDIVHVRSHQKKNNFICNLNNYVDKLATDLLI